MNKRFVASKLVRAAKDLTAENPKDVDIDELKDKYKHLNADVQSINLLIDMLENAIDYSKKIKDYYHKTFDSQEEAVIEKVESMLNKLFSMSEDCAKDLKKYSSDTSKEVKDFIEESFEFFRNDDKINYWDDYDYGFEALEVDANNLLKNKLYRYQTKIEKEFKSVTKLYRKYCR